MISATDSCFKIVDMYKSSKYDEKEFEKLYWGLQDDIQEPESYFEAITVINEDKPILKPSNDQMWLTSNESFTVAVPRAPQAWLISERDDNSNSSSEVESCLDVMKFFNGFNFNHNKSTFESLELCDNNCSDSRDSVKASTELEMINNKDFRLPEPLLPLKSHIIQASPTPSDTQDLCNYFRAIEFGCDEEIKRYSPIMEHFDLCVNEFAEPEFGHFVDLTSNCVPSETKKCALNHMLNQIIGMETINEYCDDDLDCAVQTLEDVTDEEIAVPIVVEKSLNPIISAWLKIFP